MRNYPYVVVIAESPPEADYLLKVLDDLEIPNFFPQRDTQPGEDWDQRVHMELDTADAVLVEATLKGERKELENIKSRK